MNGILDAGWRTFALLIVTTFFQGSSFAKALVPSAFAIGLLATPITVFYFSKLEIKTAKLSSGGYVVATICYIVASMGTDSLWLFLISGVIGASALSQQMPLLIHIYSTNYTTAQRGKKVAVGISLGVGLALPFGLLGGMMLERDITRFPILFQIMALACFLSAVVMWFMPSEKLEVSKGGNPLRHLSLVWKDKVFGCMLGMWMILGFGNLATMPLQIEYMTGEIYGIQASYTQVAIASIIIPSIARMLAGTVWGVAFDKYNYFLIRGGASAVVLVAMLVFFFSESMVGIYIGAAGYGVAMAGANVNWSLWVTKFAPIGQEANYMSIHSFMTGIRGLVAPFFGFYMITLISLRETIVFGAILVGLSIILLYPISQMTRR